MALESGWSVKVDEIWMFEFPNGIDERVFIYEDQLVSTLIAIDHIGQLFLIPLRENGIIIG